VPSDGSASFDSARAMFRAVMCASGPERMLADASFAVTREPEWSVWRDTALWLLAEAHLLAGHLDEATACFVEASTVGVAMSHADMIVTCESELAWLAIDRGEWQEAAERLRVALTTIEENRMHDFFSCLRAFAGAARLALHHGDPDEARRQLTRAMRARPSITYAFPVTAVRLRLHLARAYLVLGNLAAVQQLLREVDDILVRRPALGILIGEVEEFRGTLASSATSGAVGLLPLSPAELRLLPYLQTHLTADGIAERLFLSTHTVKSECRSIYRKLGVSRRHDAVQKATAIGLLGA